VSHTYDMIQWVILTIW